MAKAQSFIGKSHLGNDISLEDFKGKKVWLAFFRYASCPLCNLHIHNIIKRYDEVKSSGAVFLPVFQSDAAEVRKHAGKAGDLPFQIICDPDEKLYKQYKVGHSLAGFFSLEVMSKIIKAMFKGFFPGKMQGVISRLPSEFIFDEELNIIFQYDGKHIADHPDLEVILKQLQA